MGLISFNIVTFQT